MQHQQPVGQGAVVLEHPGRGADDAVARGAPQPAVDHVHGRAAAARRRRRPSIHAGSPNSRAGLGQRRDRQAVPGRHDLVVAPRLRAQARAANSRTRQSAHRRGSAGSASSCSVDAPCSKVPVGGDREQRRGRRAVACRAPRRAAPASRRRSGPRRPRCRRPGRRRSRPRRCAGRAAGTPPSRARPARPAASRCAATSGRRRAAAARCRRASSRSAARPRPRRRSSGRTRRRAGRTCRRGPSRRASARPSPSEVGSPVRSCWRSRNSSAIDGGNFGAPPNPPRSGSNVAASAAAARSSSIRGRAGSPSPGGKDVACAIASTMRAPAASTSARWPAPGRGRRAASSSTNCRGGKYVPA